MRAGAGGPRGSDVSVVIPTRDRARLLREALESVLSQTVAPGEVVVVDDGSRDTTPDVLRIFEGQVRSVRLEGEGEAAARNRGIRVASRAWIAFLDSDDRWEPLALETFLRGARRYPDAGLVAVRARPLGRSGRAGSRPIGKRSPGPDFTTASLLAGDAGGVLTPMVRRDALIEAGGFDTSLTSAADCDMWLRLSRRIRMVGLPDVVLRVRLHGARMSSDRGRNARAWLAILDKLARDAPDFVERHPRVVRRVRAKERRRLGRELLVGAGADAAQRAEARTLLRESALDAPLAFRSWTWLAAACLAPRLAARFRTRELELRERRAAR